MYCIYVNNKPDTNIFSGRGLGIGGSHQINDLDPTSTSYYGDVSAVIMQNLPIWAQLIRTPSLEVALMSNWEEKIEKLARETVQVDVTHIGRCPNLDCIIITTCNGNREEVNTGDMA